MPCYDSRTDDDARELEEVQKRLNHVTDAACWAFRKIEEAGHPIPERYATWWKEHEDFDKERA